MADFARELGGAKAAETQDDGLFGYQVRKDLYPGEDDFFRQNPHVGGMASESGHIILNPYSPAEVNHDAVARNEALRLLLRETKTVPQFEVSPRQRQFFGGTSYDGNDDDMKATIAARIYSRDPSANATPEQQQWVDGFLGRRRSFLDALGGR